MLSRKSTAYQYSVLPFGLTWAPRTFHSASIQHFPTQIEWKVHPQLSGRLADFSSVPGYAYQPHRLAAYSLGVPRAMCQHAEEHSRPKSVHNISGSMFRLRGDESPPLVRSRGDESPPLARSRGGHFVFPAPIRQGSSGQLKDFQRLLGLRVGGFSGMSSGIITHAPAAAMAGISSPVDGVDFGMFVHRGHPRRHRSSDATQISSAGEFPCVR